MKRRKFIAASAVGAIAATSPMMASNVKESNLVDQQVLELRVYTLSFRGGGRLNPYLKDALIPALNRAGVKDVMVFKEMSQSQPNKTYVLMAYDSFDHLLKVRAQIQADEVYQTASADYHKIAPSSKVYSRYDTYLMEAFKVMPQVKAPNKERKLFEFRIYEGHNDDAVRRKVMMFDKEELPIFLDTGLDPVFFGHILGGPNMPALAYMICFDSLEARDENWAKFIAHPDWKRVSALPEYADTVSNIIRVFLEQMDL
ncbi:MAG: NIPSNAP family protein [Saprospiraceae bacterium]